jgi:hypothetical protein
MSKATVQMCMSTTGFSSSSSSGLNSRAAVGSRKLQELPNEYNAYRQPQANRQFMTSNARAAVGPMQQQMNMHRQHSYPPIQQQQQQQHPQPPQQSQPSQTSHGLRKPQFDMNLNGLLAQSPELAQARLQSAQPMKSEFNEDFAMSRQPQYEAQGALDLTSPQPQTQNQPHSQAQTQYAGQTPPLTDANLATATANGSLYASPVNIQGFEDMSLPLGGPGMDLLSGNSMGSLDFNGDGQGIGGLDLGFGWGIDGEGGAESGEWGGGREGLDMFDGFYYGTGV